MNPYKLPSSSISSTNSSRTGWLLGPMVSPSTPVANLRVERTVTALEAGQIVLHPTDTVPGLTCHPSHHQSINYLSFVKGRSVDKALLSLVHSTERALKYMACLPPGWRRALDLLWPGPLSVIWQASDLAPRSLVAADGTIGLRVPLLTKANEWYGAVLKEVNLPLPTTSVNRAASPAAKTWRQAQDFCQRTTGYIFDPTEIKADLHNDGGFGADSSLNFVIQIDDRTGGDRSAASDLKGNDHSDAINHSGEINHSREADCRYKTNRASASAYTGGSLVDDTGADRATSSDSLPPPPPSTIVALAPDGRFDVLRAGMVSRGTIEEALERPGRDI